MKLKTFYKVSGLPMPITGRLVSRFFTKVKLTSFLLFTLCLQASALGFAQEKITLVFRNAPLEKVFKDIRRQTGFLFVYTDETLQTAKTVNLNLRDVTLKQAMDACLNGQPLTYAIVDDAIVIKPKPRAETAPVTSPPPLPADTLISGTVTSDTGEPLPGVNVRLKNGTTGTVTNEKGVFSLSVPPSSVLIVSYVGYLAQEINTGSRKNFNIQLQISADPMNEVVVVGFGQQKKISVTAAISSIGTKELLQRPQANVSNMLVGMLPGVIAVQRSGEPGSDQSTIRIRGTGTFNGNADPLIMIDGIERPEYNNIDPNEIESVNILKDASATAIYGVRGANGVILITTKRGKAGQAPSMSYSGNVAFQMPTLLPDYLNSYDYARLYNEALMNDTYITGSPYTPKFSEADIEAYRTGSDPIFHPNTDWMEIFLRDYSMQTQHNLNISGGGDRVRYFISAGYFQQQGIYRYSELNPEFSTNAKNTRYNFRSNLDFTITKRFSANVQMAAQIEDRNYPGNSAATIWRDISWTNPLGSPGLIDGKVIRLQGQTSVVNPFWTLLSAGYYQQFRNNLNSSVRLNHELDFITRGLSIYGTVAYDIFYSQAITRSKEIPYYIAMKDPGAADSIRFIPQGEEGPLGFAETMGKNRRIYAETGINYARSFGRHNVTGLLLYNQSKYFSPDLVLLVPNAYQGLVGRVTYNYDNRYLAELNMGYNGTENFAEGRRFGLFPAFSLGWVASQESFFPKGGAISYLKIRGSYGETGNDKIGGERFLYLPSSYGYSGSYYFGTVGQNYQSYQGSVENKIGNPLLTWERAQKSNLGLELNLFNDRLTFVGDVFRENRNNILANRGTIPNIVGANLPAYNLGRMRNSGFEAEIGYKGKVQAFNYWVKANYTFARNKILFMDEAPKTYPYQNVTGNRAGQFMGLLSDGFYNTWEEVNDPKRPVSQWNNNKIQPGDIRYVDVNGDGKIDVDDRMPIGYSNIPEKIFGISFGGNIKGFDFSVLLQGADNVSIQYFGRALWPFINGQESAKANILERWTPERYEQGLPITFPRLSMNPNRNTDHNFQESDFWTRDASYVRLKNAEIGYTINGAVTRKWGLNGVRLYANGANLFTWSDAREFDPESPSAGGNTEITAYPLQKVFNMGVNIKF
ncbi:TonB-dependent receptor [Chitinophaga sp. XS-30]|uniref:TonB-dependent receptor n=1 Tax=Chitinophaga sp. XS-30 TaxID=2604421 RepID=UPI001AEFE1EB|nr:TonB-dependent receptor [Chitinophaga sp. XS-30]